MQYMAEIKWLIHNMEYNTGQDMVDGALVCQSCLQLISHQQYFPSHPFLKLFGDSNNCKQKQQVLAYTREVYGVSCRNKSKV